MLAGNEDEAEGQTMKSVAAMCTVITKQHSSVENYKSVSNVQLTHL